MRNRIPTWRSILVCLAMTTGAACSATHPEQQSVDRNQEALTQQDAPGAGSRAAAAAAPAVPAPLPADELAARTEIALEGVEQRSEAWQREYRRNELAALRAAQQTKRAIADQAQASRPTRASASRDLLDSKISKLRASITAGDDKVRMLEAQPN
jgi:hypothetical protein